MHKVHSFLNIEVIKNDKSIFVHLPYGMSWDEAKEALVDAQAAIHEMAEEAVRKAAEQNNNVNTGE